MIPNRTRFAQQSPVIALTLLVGFSPIGLCACSTTKTTTTTREVPSSTDPDATVEERTTTTTSSPGCSGVLSCTVDVVGDVIAFPFKVVGAVITAIF
jgi:hypothetical protein